MQHKYVVYITTRRSFTVDAPNKEQAVVEAKQLAAGQLRRAGKEWNQAINVDVVYRQEGGK